MRLSPRPRKFAVWNDSWPKNPSNCDTPAPKVSWLRFCSSSFILTSTLFSVFGSLVDVDVLAGPFERLEVAELIQALDAVLQRLGVEDAVLVQPQSRAG